jgi:hypothetical protein
MPPSEDTRSRSCRRNIAATDHSAHRERTGDDRESPRNQASGTAAGGSYQEADRRPARFRDISGAAMLRTLSRHRAQTAIASQQVWRITSHSCGWVQIAHGSSFGANGDGVTVIPGS